MPLAGAYAGLRTYSALENGVTAGTADQGAQLQKVADEIGATGGGVLAIPTGALVSVNMRFYSGAAPSGFAAGLRLPNGVHLQLDGELRQCPNQPHGKWSSSGTYSLLRTKDGAHARNIRVFGRGVLNGNSANNAAGDYHFDGLNFGRGLDLHCEGITIKNIRGTGGSPPNETFGFIAYRSTNTIVENVTITSDDGGLSSTGFADSFSQGLLFNNCTADNMQRGQGFALHATGHVHFTNCKAYRVHSNAFNLEAPSGPVIYTSCIAGGIAGPDYKGKPAEQYTAGQDLGCGVAVYHAGFQLNMDAREYYPSAIPNPQASVMIEGCASQDNKNGIGLKAAAYNPVPVTVVGSDLRYNDGFGIINNSVAANNATVASTLKVDLSNIVSNNGSGNFESPIAYTS